MIPISVSFYDGDKLIISENKNLNTTYEFPAPPAKEGFLFAGWELNGNVIPLEENTYNLPLSSTGYVFKATWNHKPMTVSFYYGNELLDSIEIIAGESYSFPEFPEDASVTFTGWMLGAVAIPAGQKEFSHSYSAEGYRYDAAFDKNPMTASFYSAEDLIDSFDIVVGEAYALPATPVKKGYSFTGWKIGDKTLDVDATEFTIDEYSEDGYTFIATWDQLSMRVTFLNGSDVVFEDDIYAGQTYAFPPAPEKYGYEFTGWKLGDSPIPLEQSNYSLEYSEAGYEYVATWAPKSMTVSFYVDGEVYCTNTIVTDGVNSFPSAPTKNGYDFIGWKIGEAVIPLEQLTYSHEYSETGYRYDATWNCTYLEINNFGTVTCTDKTITEAIIPEYLNGIRVTKIGDYAFHECSSLTSISIPDSVNTIGDGAFNTCKEIHIDREKGSVSLGVVWKAPDAKVYWQGVLDDDSNGSYEPL